MIVKKHCSIEKQLILAVCDSDLKGRKFVKGDLQLDLSSDFYNGEEMDEEKTIKLLKCAYIINLVGKKSVEAGIKAGVIDKDNILEVEGIPHAEGLVITED